MGITPFQVLGNMKRQGTGPFSLAQPNTTSGQTRLGIKGINGKTIPGPMGMDGVYVETLRPDSPAARAGVKKGDIITYLNSERIRDIDSLEKLISGIPTGAKSRIVVYSGGREVTLGINFVGGYEKPRIQVGPSGFGATPGPGKMLEKIKNNEIGPARQMSKASSITPRPPKLPDNVGPASVLKRMKRDSSGPFAIINRNKTTASSDVQYNSPTIPKIAEPTKPQENEKTELDVDDMMGDFSVYLENSELIGLSDSQIKEIKKLSDQQKKRNLQKNTQMKLVIIELGKIFRQDDVAFDSAEKLLAFASEIEKNWRINYMKSLKQLYSHLTTRQKKFLAQH